MNDLKIGDRVRVISESKLFKTNKNKIINGMIGTIKDQRDKRSGVEFDDYVGGHDGLWNGKDGHCWYVDNEYLEKIEETGKEKTKTFEQKILEVLREEIGVEIGEEFDVYEKGKSWLTCKFEGNELFCKVNDEFQSSEVWKDIVCNFCGLSFERKPFMPKYGEVYFFLAGKYDENKNINFGVLQNMWTGDIGDYGMWGLGNVFKCEKEALENKDKILKKLERLRRWE